MSEAFFKKYPNADPSRFVFKDGKVLFKINPDNEYRLLDIESDTYQRTSTWTKYLTSYKKRGFGIFFSDGTIQPLKKSRFKDDVHAFKAYVNENQFFTTNLPPPVITNSSSADYKKNPYMAAIVAAYVTTYLCGVSTQHLAFDDKTPKVITSIMRYHLYYQIKKFLKNPDLLDRYISSVPSTVKSRKPTRDVWTEAYHQGKTELLTWLSEQPDRKKIRNYKYSTNAKGNVTGIRYEKVTSQEPKDVSDYKKFVATSTDGLTKIGQKLLQQSVESYVYAILGSQARLRWSIVGEDAKSLQTQEVFYKIVKDTIVQTDTTSTVTNMRTAIQNTNVVLNMAISPGMILIPSDLILQKTKIPGYNNVLTLATDKMKFGKNTDVNYKAPVVIKEIAPDKTSAKIFTPTSAPTPAKEPNIALSNPSLESEILGITMTVGGFLISLLLF